MAHVLPVHAVLAAQSAQYPIVLLLLVGFQARYRHRAAGAPV